MTHYRFTCILLSVKDQKLDKIDLLNNYMFIEVSLVLLSFRFHIFTIADNGLRLIDLAKTALCHLMIKQIELLILIF